MAWRTKSDYVDRLGANFDESVEAGWHTFTSPEARSHSSRALLRVGQTPVTDAQQKTTPHSRCSGHMRHRPIQRPRQYQTAEWFRTWCLVVVAQQRIPTYAGIGSPACVSRRPPSRRSRATEATDEPRRPPATLHSSAAPCRSGPATRTADARTNSSDRGIVATL